MDASTLTRILQAEIQRATGCTEAASIAYATARAVQELGGPAESIEVALSPNMYKNAILVGIPGTGLRGARAAAAAGAVYPHPEHRLEILEHITAAHRAEVQTWLDGDRIQVTCLEDAEGVYARVTASGPSGKASAVIAGAHDHLAEVRRGGQVVFQDAAQTAECQLSLLQYPLRQVIQAVLDEDPETSSFLLDGVQLNRAMAEEGLRHGASRLSQGIGSIAGSGASGLSTAMFEVQRLTSAASEARMTGLDRPVMAITGSGNHGITHFLGVYALAEHLGASREQLLRALAISAAITVYIKEITGKMTAFCGCAIAPATGLAAAAVHLLGGGWEQMTLAMQTVVGTFAGLLCDGAKESCAYKVSTAAGAAVEFAHLAMQGVGIPPVNGIVGPEIEATLRSLGELNRQGMRETDRVVIRLIEQHLTGA